MRQRLKIFEDALSIVEMQMNEFLSEQKGVAVSISLSKTGVIESEFHESLNAQKYALALLWDPDEPKK